MSTDMANEAVQRDEHTASLQAQIASQSPRRIRNDHKWDTFKNEIHRIYIAEYNTLQDTMRTIAQRFGFKASERKWKEKLKEWKFDKKISATDMGIVVAKAEKRAREEGKETIFFHGEAQITPERIEQFKRRKTTQRLEPMSPGAETPMNITYHTPPTYFPEISSDQSLEQDDSALETPENVLLPCSCPFEEKISTQGHYETRAVLSSVFETSLDDMSKLKTAREKTSSLASPPIRADGLPSHGMLDAQHSEADTTAIFPLIELTESLFESLKIVYKSPSAANSGPDETFGDLPGDASPSESLPHLSIAISEMDTSRIIAEGDGQISLPEASYRQTIESLRSSGEIKKRLKCQLFLGNILESLGRDSEALYLLLETVIEQFTLRTTLLDVTKVMECIEKLHAKIGIDLEMGDVTTSFTELFQQLDSKNRQRLGTESPLVYWPASADYTDIWVKFVRLGSCYSELGKFDAADLCFAFPPPPPRAYTSIGRNARFGIELTQFHKECCLHFRRQGKVLDSLKQLKNAFQDMWSSMLGTEQYDQDLVTVLEQLLADNKPEEFRIWEHDPLVLAWRSAQEACRKLAFQRLQQTTRTSEWFRMSRQNEPRRDFFMVSPPQYEDRQLRTTASKLSHASSGFSISSISSRFGVTYSVGSASIVSNSEFMVP